MRGAEAQVLRPGRGIGREGGRVAISSPTPRQVAAELHLGPAEAEVPKAPCLPGPRPPGLRRSPGSRRGAHSPLGREWHLPAALPSTRRPRPRPFPLGSLSRGGGRGLALLWRGGLQELVQSALCVALDPRHPHAGPCWPGPAKRACVPHHGGPASSTGEHSGHALVWGRGRPRSPRLSPSAWSCWPASRGV